jgi:replicative DNA helicase
MEKLDATPTPVNPPACDPLTKPLAEDILALLAHSEEFGRIVAGQVSPYLFENECYRLFATRILQYWQEHKRPPGKAHTTDLFADILENARHPWKDQIRHMLVSVIFLVDTPSFNPGFVLSELDKFKRTQELKHATLRTAEFLETRQHEAIADVEQLWNRILRTRPASPNGLDLGDLERTLAYLHHRHEREFPTGIALFDRLGVAPTRGCLMTVLGLSGEGKTWALIDLGKRALMAGKKVMHASVEMSEEPLSARYHQSIHALAQKEDYVTTSVTRLELENNQLMRLRCEPVQAKFSLEDANFDRKLKALYRSKNYDRTAWLNHVHIRRFASLTIDQLSSYIDECIDRRKFTPDLVLVDYLGLLKTDAKNQRIELGRQVQDLRALAEERNIAVVAAQQINRQGHHAKEITRNHIAEDYSIIATSDFILVLQRWAKEKQYKLARLMVDKARDAPDGFGVVLSQNLEHGQFCLSSAPLRRDRYAQMIDELPELARALPGNS